MENKTFDELTVGDSIYRVDMNFMLLKEYKIKHIDVANNRIILYFSRHRLDVYNQNVDSCSYSCCRNEYFTDRSEAVRFLNSKISREAKNKQNVINKLQRELDELLEKKNKLNNILYGKENV